MFKGKPETKLASFIFHWLLQWISAPWHYVTMCVLIYVHARNIDPKSSNIGLLHLCSCYWHLHLGKNSCYLFLSITVHFLFALCFFLLFVCPLIWLSVSLTLCRLGTDGHIFLHSLSDRECMRRDWFFFSPLIGNICANKGLRVTEGWVPAA